MQFELGDNCRHNWLEKKMHKINGLMVCRIWPLMISAPLPSTPPQKKKTRLQRRFIPRTSIVTRTLLLGVGGGGKFEFQNNLTSKKKKKRPSVKIIHK